MYLEKKPKVKIITKNCYLYPFSDVPMADFDVIFPADIKFSERMALILVIRR